MHLYINPGADLLIALLMFVFTGTARTGIPRDELGAQQTFFVFSMLFAMYLTNDAVLSVGQAIAAALR